MFSPAVVADNPKRIQLPRSSTRLQIPEVYCKLVTEITSPGPFGACLFEGKIHKPGETIETAALPRPAVVIECAGPQGGWQRGKKRPYLYLLWSFDFTRWEWAEVARAVGVGSEWTAVLREAAWRALHPQPQFMDVISRSRSVADELVEEIDKRLQAERPDVRASALHAIYERVTGRLANCA